MAERTLILAFETSCDETSVAVVENGTKILSNIVATQIDSHQRFAVLFQRWLVGTILSGLPDALIRR